MAKRTKKLKRLKRLARAEAKQDAAAMLKEAVLALRHGSSERAISMALTALDFADTPAQAETGRQLIAEAHFRASAETPLEARLPHLEAALEVAPDDSRLRFFRALNLWQLGRVADAKKDLEAVYAQAPQRPRVGYLLQLSRLALGVPQQGGEEEAALSEPEAETLRLLASLLNGDAATARGPLLGPETLWQALTEMACDADAAPIACLQENASSARPLVVRRLARYYLGVAALRAGDVRTAEATWTELAAGGFSSAMLVRNLHGLQREGALRLAEQGRWQDVLQSVDEAAVTSDRVLGEIVALAHEQLGYAAAQVADWHKAVTHWRAAEKLAGRRQLAQNLALAEEALANWAQAGSAWRAVLRRRPRKATHPDYLSDDQVAAIWRHAGQCYQRADELDEAISCFKQALKYASGDLELEGRFELAETLLENDQLEAAQNELERILARDANHVKALMLLGASYQGDWRRDPTPIWRRVLELEPDNREAREALAQAHLERLQFLPLTEVRKRLDQALEELPEHPRLLLALAMSYQGTKGRAARELLKRAYHAAPDDLAVVSLILRELVRLGAEDVLADVIGNLREKLELLPAFWLDQGDEVLENNLDPCWAQRFFDEGVRIAEHLQDQPKPGVDSTKASALAYAFEAALIAEDEELADYYQERILAEAPDSGAPEYITAYRLFHEEDDVRGAKRLLRAAERKAKEAGDRGVLRSVESAEELLRQPTFPLDVEQVLERLKGRL